MLFAGDNYYPEGGMDDFVGRTATLVEAIKLLHTVRNRDWFNIYDSESDVIYNHNEFYGLTSNEQRLEWATEKDVAMARHIPEMPTTPANAFDRIRHGSLYDRGSADSYYGRERYPHWYPNGTYNGDCILAVTKDEIAEYMAGYDYNEEFGDKKSW
jgi:hypothetical protein